MTDIFISYSQADRLAVERLAAFLQTEGWSVWWDRSLAAGDTYRDEISKQLSNARAVIVVWTSDSINSRFVRAEAGRAMAEGKLIPVKAGGVNFTDIPLPFGEMHTEPLENRSNVKAAVAAMLSKPRLQTAGLYAASASLRYSILTWLGIVGGAITLFNSVSGLVELAKWVRLLLDNWIFLTHAFWSAVFQVFNLRVPNLWVHPLTFIGFMLTTIVGSRLAVSLSNRRLADGAERERPSLRLSQVFVECNKLGLATNFALFCAAVAYNVLHRTVPVDRQASYVAGLLFDIQPDWFEDHYRMAMIFATTAFLASVFCANRLASATTALLIGGLSLVCGFAPMSVQSAAEWAMIKDDNSLFGMMRTLNHFEGHIGARVLMIFGPIVLIHVALMLLPAPRLNRRLMFVAVGVCMMFALNEVAKVDLAALLRF